MNKSKKPIFVVSIYLLSVIVLMNVSNNSLGAVQELSEIPEAKSIYDTETMHLPKSVGYFIVLIANEAHHGP